MYGTDKPNKQTFIVNILLLIHHLPLLYYVFLSIHSKTGFAPVRERERERERKEAERERE